MRTFHSQNLNDDKRGNPVGSMFWHGRCWWRFRHEVRLEWCLGKHATMCHWGIEFGEGDGDDGVQLLAGIPFLFAAYLSVAGIYRCKPRELGFFILGNCIHVHTFNKTEESHSADPWWKKGFSWDFPWALRHHKTELLQHKCPLEAKPIYVEPKGSGSLGDGTFQQRQAFQKSMSQTYPYRYVLKNGEVQEREATVYVDRMTWRAKWWPVIPLQKVRTSINISFNAEVGEGTGSWKGGCVGCGYDMMLTETPFECLQRMERERKFTR